MIFTLYFFIFSVFLLITPKKGIKFFIVVFLLGMGLLAFFIQPLENMDLYRHYMTLEEFRFGGWNSVENHKYFESLPIFSIYFYMISFLGKDGFLPMITMIIEYYLIISLFMKFSRTYNLELKYQKYGIICFVFIYNFFAAVSGIRNMLAFSIFIYFLYMDLVERKARIICFSIYGILALFHSSVTILIVFRLILFLNVKLVKFLAKLMILSPIFLPFLVKILEKISHIKFFELLRLQIMGYLKLEYFEPLSYLYNIGLLVLCIVLFLLTNKTISRIETFQKFHLYVMCILFFTVGAVNNFNLFIRFATLLTMITPLYLIYYFGICQKKRELQVTKRKSILVDKNLKAIILIFIIGMVFACSLYLTLFQYKAINF